jgi:dipeptidyl aminopeptidase/acylaminoacyl peptidase
VLPAANRTKNNNTIFLTKKMSFMKRIIFPLCLLTTMQVCAQKMMTPELLLSVKKVNADGLSQDGKTLYYTVREANLAKDESTIRNYQISLPAGERKEVQAVDKMQIFDRRPHTWYALKNNSVYSSSNKGKTWEIFYFLPAGAENVQISPDSKSLLFTMDVPLVKVLGKEIYPDLPNTAARIYTDLNYRHWDTWEDGKFSHVFLVTPKTGGVVDIMRNEAFDCPQKPYGGAEDVLWSPDSKGIVYVCKKKYGKDYAVSTNTDLYYYDLATQQTTNWTANMEGYDVQPAFSPEGKRIAWLSMRRDGYEADKNSLYVMDLGNKNQVLRMNLTTQWDDEITGFKWGRNGTQIYYAAPKKGTEQLFSVAVPAVLDETVKPAIRQITHGDFDVNSVIGQAGDKILVSRCDFNHASELFSVDSATGQMTALTHENDSLYSTIALSDAKLRMVKTFDKQEMGVWVIYPPHFNPQKKYPALLYCQGGPQSALTPFYSTRWNFQLMAAQGYIVVAPNRRGMPGWGSAWNEAISKDWGGGAMQDYLAAIDAVAKEDYVDKNRLGCVGASYGGYSVFMLAGIHQNRFKSFISHCGLFDLKSWYGTTEELWFANWDIGGPYWQSPPLKSYTQFDPSNYVANWNTPILVIQGGKDFRVPDEQGREAFQAAQLRGLKSKLLYLPDENHWVLKTQNALLWHREFFKWLDETLK